jgi:excisionase family DNA binding protein
MEQSDAFLTLSDAARVVQLSPAYLRRLASVGRLEGRKYGKTWIVSKSSVDAFASTERLRGRPMSRAKGRDIAMEDARDE